MPGIKQHSIDLKNEQFLRERGSYEFLKEMDGISTKGGEYR